MGNYVKSDVEELHPFFTSRDPWCCLLLFLHYRQIASGDQFRGLQIWDPRLVGKRIELLDGITHRAIVWFLVCPLLTARVDWGLEDNQYCLFVYTPTLRSVGIELALFVIFNLKMFPIPEYTKSETEAAFPRLLCVDPGILCRHYSPKRLDTSLLRNVFHTVEDLCFHWGGRNSRTMLTPGKRLSSRRIVLARYHPHLKCWQFFRRHLFRCILWDPNTRGRNCPLADSLSEGQAKQVYQTSTRTEPMNSSSLSIDVSLEELNDHSKGCCSSLRIGRKSQMLFSTYETWWESRRHHEAENVVLGSKILQNRSRSEMFMLPICTCAFGFSEMVHVPIDWVWWGSRICRVSYCVLDPRSSTSGTHFLNIALSQRR